MMCKLFTFYRHGLLNCLHGSISSLKVRRGTICLGGNKKTTHVSDCYVDELPIVVWHISLCLWGNWNFREEIAICVCHYFGVGEQVSTFVHSLSSLARAENSAINPSVGSSPHWGAVSFPAYSPMLSSRKAQRCLLLDNVMLSGSPQDGAGDNRSRWRDYRLSRPCEEEGAPMLWYAVFVPLAVPDLKHLESCNWHVTSVQFEMV